MYQFKIGDYFTWDTWQLSLSSYSIGEPTQKTNYVEIPYGNGSIDLSEAITGKLQYGDRVIEATFDIIGNRSANQTKHQLIKSLIQGKKLNIKVPEDDSYYYVGRIAIQSLENQNNVNRFVLNALCEPYKYKNDVTSHDLTMGLPGTLTETFVNDVMDTLPTFTVSASTQIVFGSYSVTVNAGSHQLSSVIFEQGDNEVTFNASNGTTINVSYQEGAL